MAKQAFKGKPRYTPEQYCPICQVDHDKAYEKKIVKLEDEFNKSNKTEKDIKKHKETLEKTEREHTVLTLVRSNRGKNTLICQASVKQIDKAMQHCTAPHFEKSFQ